MTRKKTIPPILPETFEKIVAPWLTGIAKKDIVAVISYPASDRQRRYLNLLDNKKLQKKYLHDSRTYLWISVDFRVDPIDDVPDLETTVIRKITETTGKKLLVKRNFQDTMSHFKQKYRKKVILACFGCEELLATRKIPILIWFTIMCRVDTMRMLLFFETNLFSSKSLELFGKVPAFQPRISIMRLYDDSDTRQFIRHMTTNEWNIHISQEMEDTILTECKGLLLLVKEALWHIRDHPQVPLRDVFSHPEMRFNLASLWQGFSSEEQEVMDRIVKRMPLDSDQHKASIIHLVDTGLIAPYLTTYKITVPLVAQYRRECLLQGKSLTLGLKSELLVDSTPVTTHFSKSQKRVLTYFLTHPNTVISRDTIALSLWPTQTHEHYSDWAIDSQISRLRQRLQELSIHRNTVQTHKGKGFIFQN